MAGTTKTLYAWAIPGFFSGSPVDHTWVTTYDNRTFVYANEVDVAAAAEDYWFCWGSFHPTAGAPSNPTGFLGAMPGDITYARCLVESNADSRKVVAARGTILAYGIEGVCHQLANQVLFATTGSPHLLVHLARGYRRSSAIYGDYGLNAGSWAAKIASCGSGGGGAGDGDQESLARSMDTFEAHARAVLSGAEDQAALQELLQLRRQTQAALLAMRTLMSTEREPSAEEINARNQRFFDRAAQILGPQRYELVFDAPPANVTLVDPTVHGEMARKRTFRRVPDVRRVKSAHEETDIWRHADLGTISIRRTRDSSRGAAPARAGKKKDAPKKATKKKAGPKKATKKKATPKKKVGKKRAAPKKKAAPRKKVGKKMATPRKKRASKKAAPKKIMAKRKPSKKAAKRKPAKKARKAKKRK